LTPSRIFFSKIQTLTSFPVVLCVAPRTRHSPTVILFELLAVLDEAVAVDGRYVEDEAGDGDAEWRA
jgi:hypothetical protein